MAISQAPEGGTFSRHLEAREGVCRDVCVYIYWVAALEREERKKTACSVNEEAPNMETISGVSSGGVLPPIKKGGGEKQADVLLVGNSSW